MIPGKNIINYLKISNFQLIQVAPPGIKWPNHITTGSCIALTFLFIKPATKRDLLVNPTAAGT